MSEKVIINMDQESKKESNKKLNKKYIKWSVAIVVVIVVIILGSYMISVKKYQDTVKNMTFSEVDIKEIPDGTYEGDCNVDYIYAKVQVTVQGGIIKNIDLVEHKNDKGAAAESIVDDVIEQQSLDVDVVTGATNSSKVIKKAVENALIKGYSYAN